MTDGSGSSSWTYDQRGRTLTEVKTISGASQSFTSTWTYNSADLPATMTYPNGEILTYAYDAAGSVASLASNSGGTYAQGMQYDEAARLTTMILGNNIINRSFVYEPWGTATSGGLLTSLSAARVADGSPVQSL